MHLAIVDTTTLVILLTDKIVVAAQSKRLNKRARERCVKKHVARGVTMMATAGAADTRDVQRSRTAKIENVAFIKFAVASLRSFLRRGERARATFFCCC